MDIIPYLSDENTKLQFDFTAERREAISRARLFPYLLLLPPLDLLDLQLLTGTLPFSGQSLDISGQRLVGRSRLVQLLAKHCVDLCQAGTPINTTRVNKCVFLLLQTQLGSTSACFLQTDRSTCIRKYFL